MNDVIKTARDLKSDAMDFRDDQEYDRAEALIVEAETLLKVLLQELRKGGESAADPNNFEVKVAEQLGHILGSKGGIYRRWGKYEDSAKAYDEGYEHENWVASRGIANSYDLVQRLVARVFMGPSAVGNDAEVLGLPLRRALLEAKDEVEPQFNRDEYARADLAMICLLLGSDGWERALDRFINSSPSPSPYAFEATIDVMDDLKSVLSGRPDTPPDLADRLDGALSKLEPYRPKK